jgi:hypothetical protein
MGNKKTEWSIMFCTVFYEYLILFMEISSYYFTIEIYVTKLQMHELNNIIYIVHRWFHVPTPMKKRCMDITHHGIGIKMFQVHVLLYVIPFGPVFVFSWIYCKDDIIISWPLAAYLIAFLMIFIDLVIPISSYNTIQYKHKEKKDHDMFLDPMLDWSMDVLLFTIEKRRQICIKKPTNEKLQLK